MPYAAIQDLLEDLATHRLKFSAEVVRDLIRQTESAIIGQLGTVPDRSRKALVRASSASGTAVCINAIDEAIITAERVMSLTLKSKSERT